MVRRELTGVDNFISSINSGWKRRELPRAVSPHNSLAFFHVRVLHRPIRNFETGVIYLYTVGRFNKDSTAQETIQGLRST